MAHLSGVFMKNAIVIVSAVLAILATVGALFPSIDPVTGKLAYDSFDSNNFDNDVFVYGVDSAIRIAPFADVVIGAYGLYDGSIVQNDKDLGAVAVGMRFGDRATDLSLDVATQGRRFTMQGWGARIMAMGQFGRIVGGAADRSDSSIRSYGIMAKGGIRHKWVSLHAGGTVMGADDVHQGNDLLSFS